MTYPRIHAVAFLHHGIGDGLLALPFARRYSAWLRAQGKRGIVLVSSPGVREILELADLGAHVMFSQIPNKGRWRLLWRLSDWEPEYIFMPHAAPSVQSWLLGLLRPARSFVVGPKHAWLPDPFDHAVPFHVPGRHKEDLYLSYLPLSASQAIRNSDRWLKNKNQSVAGSSHSRKQIVLTPSSNELEKHKRWPATHYAALATRLLEGIADVDVVLLGGPSDAQLLRKIRMLVVDDSDRMSLVCARTIRETLEVLEKANCCVSACASGVHLASAVRCPVVGLYGPTNAGFTGPTGERMIILRAENFRCAPCYRMEFRLGCGSPACMSAVPVDAVFGAVRRILAGGGGEHRPWLETTKAQRAELKK